MGPDLDLNHLTLMVFLKEFLKNVNFEEKISRCQKKTCKTTKPYLYPRYEVYREYIVFAFSVIMFVCLFVCKIFFRQRFLSNYLG